MRGFLYFIIGLVCFSIQAQDITKELHRNGFENVRFFEKSDSIKIYFEQSSNRNPYFSMKSAGEIIQPSTNLNKGNLSWIPLESNQPVGVYDSSDYSVQYLNNSYRKQYESTNFLDKGSKLILRIHPQVVSRFGYYSDPFETKINAIIDTRVNLARGLSFQTGIAIPLHNNLDNHGMKLRAAPTMLHYFTQPWNSHFMSLSGGTFYGGRYGLDAEYRYADLKSAWSFGLAGGVTGFYRLYGLEYYSEPMDDIYAVADVEWRTGVENTSLKLSAGQFLYKDKGVRLDLIRQFAAAEIGLFASHTDMGTTGGFQFAFSIWPGKIISTPNFELRTTEEFRWEYSYNNITLPVAKQFRIGMPRLSNMLRNYNEDWVKYLNR